MTRPYRGGRDRLDLPAHRRKYRQASREARRRPAVLAAAPNKKDPPLRALMGAQSAG